jgi:peptidoglycan/LPS O-acetylase OafA/YrhL
MKLTGTIEIGPPIVIWIWVGGILLIPLIYVAMELVHLATGWDDSPDFRSILKFGFLLAPSVCLAAICTIRGMPLWMRLLAIPLSVLIIAGTLLMTFIAIGIVELPHCRLKGVQ